MKEAVYTRVRSVASLGITARDSDDTFEGTAVDRSQYQNYARTAAVLVFAGTVTDGNHVISLEASDNNSDWTAVTSAELLGTTPTLTSSNDERVHEFGYTGAARYLRVVSTTTSTSDGGVYGAAILLGDARREPIARA